MCQLRESTVVGLAEPLCEDTIPLSTLDQHAIRLYSKVLAGFETKETVDIGQAIEHLKEGLARALCEVPDFAANVKAVPGSKTNRLELDIGPESGVLFQAVDHRSSADEGSESCPDLLRNQTYQDLEKANFPLTTIPSRFYCVPNAKPEDEHPDEGLPALLVRANIINGGLLLGITWHHTVADGRGIGNFSRVWARETNLASNHVYADIPEPPTDGSRDRWRLNLKSDGATIADFPDYEADPFDRRPDPTRPHLLDCKIPVPPNTKTSMWHFSSAAIRSLVSLVNSGGAAAGSTNQQFTQSEAISALLWKHVSLARQLHVSQPPDASSLFSTRMDFRRRVNPPLAPEFIGNANQPVPRTRASIRDLCTPSTAESLAAVAQMIKKAVAENDEKKLRSLAGLVDTLPSVTDLVLMLDTNPGPDFAITDVSGLDAMDLDWGRDLGCISCIRALTRYRGFTSILPRDQRDGHPVVLLCDADAVTRLRADTMFTQFAEFLY